MNRYLLILFLSLNSLTLQFSCAEPNKSSNKKFTIGAILSLTGPTADYGISIQNAILLAQEDYPDLFSDIEFRFEDVQYDPKMAVAAFQRLAKNKDIDLIYTWGVAFCKVIGPLADTYKVPTIGQCIDRESAKDKRYFMRFMNVIDEYLIPMSQYLKKHNHKKFAMLIAESAFTGEMWAAFKRAADPASEFVFVEEITTTDQDFRALLARLKGLDIDAVGVFLMPGQVSSFYRQAKEMGISFPMTFGTNFFETLSELKAANGAMDGAIFSNNSISPKFLSRYKAKFKNESQLSFAATAYEFAVSLARELKKRGARPKGEEVLNLFSDLDVLQGDATGAYKAVNDKNVGRYVQFPVVIKEVRENEFIELSMD